MWVVFILLVTVHVYTKYNFALYPLAFIFLYSKITIMSMKIFLLILIHFTDKMNFSASSLLHTPPHMQRASVHHNEHAGEIIPLPGFGPICKKGNQVCWFAVTALLERTHRCTESLYPIIISFAHFAVWGNYSEKVIYKECYWSKNLQFLSAYSYLL